MALVAELDPVIKSALKLLHSSNLDAAQKLRETLDDCIKTKYGSSSKSLTNTINSKFLKFESTAPGTKVTKQRKIRAKSVIEKTVLIDSSSDGSMEILESVDETGSTLIDDSLNVMGDDNAMMELEDLLCVVCRRMESNSRNRLMECQECSSLYHMECHNPTISEDQDNQWVCTICKSKFNLARSPAKSSPSPDRSSSSSVKTVTPTIKIVSSSDRVKPKKSSKSQSHDSKRKHK